MTNFLLNIDAGMIDWARAQFALTAIYHWLFVPLTLGLAVIMGIMETCYYRTKKPFWKDAAKFWQKLFGINFAMGVATGIILEFEFGTNWSNYSWFVGDIFGAAEATKTLYAFAIDLSTHIKTTSICLDTWNKFDDTLKNIFTEEFGDKMYTEYLAWVEKMENQRHDKWDTEYSDMKQNMIN